jgi:tripartite-type tricarboxylate transporter receptor subunit TctC
MKTLWGGVAAGCLALAMLYAGPARADAVEDFYRGKNVSLVTPDAAGGGYDTYGRLVGRYIGEFIPGKPNIVPQNMPGAGGVTQMNYLYNVAPKDGSAFAIVMHGTIFKPVLDPREVRYKVDTFRWLGSVTPIAVIGVFRKDAPASTAKELFEREVIIGGSGGTTMYLPLAINSVLGTKLKLVKGYKNTNDIMLATARNEVQGVVGIGLDSLRGSRAAGDVETRILFQMGTTRSHSLPDVPLIQEFARNNDDREVLEAIFASFSIGRVFMAPAIPDDRYAALKTAFEKTVRDPRFVAQAEKEHAEVDYVSPDAIQQIIAHVYSQPEPVLKRAAAAMVGGE